MEQTCHFCSLDIILWKPHFCCKLHRIPGNILRVFKGERILGINCCHQRKNRRRYLLITFLPALFLSLKTLLVNLDTVFTISFCIEGCPSCLTE